ncbi:hypothetical protein BGZ83_006247 [Gryganskiella cystojenkinii]|nr:hypothetical protein BGZ83_006247 [Gryganskiella cystojenkinii]
MAASSPLLHQQKSRSHSDEYESLPQHREGTHSSHPQKRNSRLTVARAVVLICIAFMLLAMVHIHYTNVFRQEREAAANLHNNDNSIKTEKEPSTVTTPTPPTSESDNNQVDPKKVGTPPPPVLDTKPETPTSTTTNTDDKPSTDNDNNKQPQRQPEKPITIDNALTTTLRYENGTHTKTFKSEFFKNPVEARKEMGSFLTTLKDRTWWSKDDSEQKNNAGTSSGSPHGTPITNAFFSYLPMGGGNNQFTSLQKAALLAKDLGRTLVIPPIAPSSHIKLWSGPRYSEFYDLEAFSAQSGIPILEWHDVKQTPDDPPQEMMHRWQDFAEDFPCIPNGGIGANDKNLYDHFRPQFLMKFKTPADLVDGTNGKATDYLYARDVLLKDSKTSSEAKNGERDLWKCLSCPYFLNGGDLNDRAWHEIGLHLKFNNKLEKMADDILDLLLKPKTPEAEKSLEISGRRHPEFIIVHLRRGDIVNKCKVGQPEAECIVQIEAIAEKVDEIEKKRRIASLQNGASDDFERLPVLVTTNEKRPEELEKLEKLKWIMLDHGDEEKDAAGHVLPSKTIKLGTMSTLGQFYPPMLDAALLTRGDYLIGMSNSRMSQLAAQRGAAWHKHTVMLM